MAKRGEAATPQAHETKARRSTMPTPLPTFDMEQYARESDQGLRIAEEAPTRPRGGEISCVVDAAPAVEIEESVSDDDAELVYWARIGEGGRVPVLARSLESLLGASHAPVDHAVLWAIDGTSTVREVVAASGLPAVIVLQALCDLLDRGIIAFQR
jgi:hypothetical protein